MQGDGKCEIVDKKGNVYRIWFNKMAIGEAETRFGFINGDVNWMKSPIHTMQFIYCAVLSAGTNIRYDDWCDLFNNEEIEIKDLGPVFQTFMQSTMVSNFIAEQQKVLAQLEQEEKNLKKKKERDILKKGKEPSITD